MNCSFYFTLLFSVKLSNSPLYRIMWCEARRESLFRCHGVYLRAVMLLPAWSQGSRCWTPQSSGSEWRWCGGGSRGRAAPQAGHSSCTAPSTALSQRCHNQLTKGPCQLVGEKGQLAEPFISPLQEGSLCLEICPFHIQCLFSAYLG